MIFAISFWSNFAISNYFTAVLSPTQHNTHWSTSSSSNLFQHLNDVQAWCKWSIKQFGHYYLLQCTVFFAVSNTLDWKNCKISLISTLEPEIKLDYTVRPIQVTSSQLKKVALLWFPKFGNAKKRTEILLYSQNFEIYTHGYELELQVW